MKEHNAVLLKVSALKAKAGTTEILHGVDLTVREGEIHAVMGPNGSGKSTLAKVLAGHPDYTVSSGKAEFDGNDLLSLEPHERARVGLFLAFQYPLEIPGVSNRVLLRTAYNILQKERHLEELDPLEFDDMLQEKLQLVRMNSSFLDRSINEGFSGGEKKRNEILQMAVLQPRLAILDETDSGLDIDALKIVANGVNSLLTANKAVILVTHYQRLLDYIIPDYVHVMVAGRIARSGDKSLAQELEQRGYEWIGASP